MELYQKFQVVQFLVILCACIIGTIQLRKTPSPERKYILPFCYIDLVMTGIAIYHYFKQIYPVYVFWIELFFTFCEILFLTNYISSIIEIKKSIITPSTIFILSSSCSYIAFKDPTIIPLLLTEIYLTIYAFLYIIWLFKNNSFFVLKKARHYWIVMGIIICYTLSIPYWISDTFIKINGTTQLYQEVSLILFISFIIFNMFMFILFIKAFLCKVQQQPSSYGPLQAQS